MRSRIASEDLPDTEFNPGIVPQPRKRCAKVAPKVEAKPKAKTDWCADCGKYGFRSEEEARALIAQQVRRGCLNQRGTFALHPYLCSHGWWHIGRNAKTLRRFDRFEENKTPRMQ